MEDWMSEMGDQSSTPEPSIKHRLWDDSGYLSATPDSLGITRGAWHRLERLASDTPLVGGLKNKCIIKQTPFPMSTEESVDLNDVDLNNFEMMEVDHAEDEKPDLCLNALDHAYNDQRLEMKFRCDSTTLLTSETGLAKLRTKLESVARGPAFHNWRRRVPADFSDRPTLDFLLYLGEKSDHSVIVTKILANLGDEDLRSARSVSSVWRRVVMADKMSRRRLKQARVKPTPRDKENEESGKKMKALIQHAGRLVPIQNFPREVNAVPSLVPVSPPVSPSKVRFHKFVKAGRSLKPGDVQTTCPRCNGPSQVDSDSQAARCVGLGCSHKFCARCRRAVHSAQDTCMLISSPRSKRHRHNPMSVGSMKSRRNLKRL